MTIKFEVKDCPDCGEKLTLIRNYRLDCGIEEIPICNKCNKAFRWPNLGWRLVQVGE